ncbi:hypothetical protein Tco_0439024 [Tanacetum coccineum]
MIPNALNKSKPKCAYRSKFNTKEVDDATAYKNNTNEASTSKAGGKNKQLLMVTNSFGVLARGEWEDDIWNDKNAQDIVAMESDDEFQHVYDETYTFMKPNEDNRDSKGDSTLVIKVQRNRNEVVRDMDNIEHEGLVVPNAFAKHYKLFMGVECTSTPLNERDTFTSQLHTDVRNHMVRLVTNDEIKKTMFSIGDNSAPVFTEALGEFKEASGDDIRVRSATT